MPTALQPSFVRRRLRPCQRSHHFGPAARQILHHHILPLEGMHHAPITASGDACTAASSAAEQTRRMSVPSTRRRLSTSMPTRSLSDTATATACRQWLMLSHSPGCDGIKGAPLPLCSTMTSSSIRRHNKRRAAALCSACDRQSPNSIRHSVPEIMPCRGCRRARCRRRGARRWGRTAARTSSGCRSERRADAWRGWGS